MAHIHESAKWRSGWAGWALVALLAGQLLLAGCVSSLCTKRLYVYRDTAQKSLPNSVALLITDPNIARALMPAASRDLEAGGRWAAEQLVQESDVYRLSIDELDGKVLYQGLCLDVTPTYACEVRPGTRQVRARLDLFGLWGHEKVKEVTRLNLEPGGCYFLRPDADALKDKHLLLKAERLPEAYTAELRARLIDWERQNSKGKSIAD
ncbi:MAG: hypothetical protein Q8M54_00405 [Desulfobaccales bacterium]|nr:hypothetical protein [Desulfobaccales bacterium]